MKGNSENDFQERFHAQRRHLYINLEKKDNNEDECTNK
jgi:hypothetical protein